MKVPFFDYPQHFLSDKQAYERIFAEVMSRGSFIMQEELRQFEADLSSFLGVRHAIGVADGTVALTMSLLSSGIQPGDEVIISSHTFIATAASIHHIGAVPVVCDCDTRGMIDVSKISELVTKKTRAIMPTQLNGTTCDMDELSDLCSSNDLCIVEDSCQALGASYSNQKAGTFGLAGSFSFFPAKTLGCFGDGGAVITNSDEVAEKILLLRNHGRDAFGNVKCFGYNGRLDNIQAAFLSYKLQSYPSAIHRRREIAATYIDAFSSIPDIVLPADPRNDKLRFDIFQNFEIQVPDNIEFQSYLAKEGVGTLIQWNGRLIHQFSELRLRSNAKFADGFSRRYIMLPMNHYISDQAVSKVVSSVISYFSK